MTRRLRSIGLCAMLSLAWADRADACASCASGDPTLRALGREAPRAGALRLGLSLSYRSEESGVRGVDALELREYRSDFAVIWGPTQSLLLFATLPVLQRNTTDDSLAKRGTAGIGDVELRGKIVLYRDRELAPRHRFGLSVGLALPTAPFRADGAGRTLPFEAQTGSGAWSALLGWSHDVTLPPWSAYAGLEALLPLASRAEFQPGRAVRGTLALQRALLDWLSIRGALDGLVESRSREYDERVRDSGGVVFFSGGDALIAAGADITFVLGARVPIAELTHGAQERGATLGLGLTFDW